MNNEYCLVNSPKKLPSGDGVVVDIFRNFLNHDEAEFVLNIRQKTAGIIGLVNRICLVERLLGIDIVGEMNGDANRKLAFRSIVVGRDGALGDIVADDFAFEFKVAVFRQNLQACLALEDIANALGECVAE